jgi:hypothetical protein
VPGRAGQASQGGGLEQTVPRAARGELHLGGFNLDDYFPSLARLDMVSAKAVKHKKRWDDLLDGLIDRHTSKAVVEGDEEDFIDVLLSLQQEYSLTRDNIKSVLMVCVSMHAEFHFSNAN